MRSLLFMLLIISGFSVASQTIITDRPDQTESSSTIPKGSLQIETGVLIGFSEDDQFSTQQILAPTTLFRYGITHGIELRVLSQFESTKNQLTAKKLSGISDLELGFKIQLFKKEEINTEIAFLSHAILPTGSTYLSNDAIGVINKFSFSHVINESISVGYNVGYDYFGTGSGNGTYSLAFGISVTDKLSLYLEPYGGFIEFDTHEANFDAGMTYLIKDNFQFDFSFGTGLNHTMNYVSVGCSINISKQE